MYENSYDGLGMHRHLLLGLYDNSYDGLGMHRHSLLGSACMITIIMVSVCMDINSWAQDICLLL